ncbi:MAG TPA: hypothetical protein VMI54_29855 [Polyangiaceae bacterium]|nr:hypothetical protein [Polyangiaceae bacterium]
MSGRFALACVVAGVLWASTAEAREHEAPSVWYRSADGCPDGAAFIGRLHGAAEGAKLAGVADRIDFVVTLGMQNERAFGRLERQTAEGRAAVREVEAKSCDEVADAIALTLTLALEPGATATPPPSPPEAAEPPEARVPPVAKPPATVQASPGKSAPSPQPPPDRAITTQVRPSPLPPAPKPAQEQAPRWFIGNDFTGEKGSLPDLLLGDRLFVELRSDVPWRASSVRLGVFVTRRTANADPAVELERFGGRLEACPLALFGPTLEVSPCLALDLGAEHARGVGSSGVSSSAVWVAASGLARGVWHATDTLALETAAGAAFPLTRYQLREAGVSAPIHRPEVIGLSVAVGIALRLR